MEDSNRSQLFRQVGIVRVYFEEQLGQYRYEYRRAATSLQRSAIIAIPFLGLLLFSLAQEPNAVLLHGAQGNKPLTANQFSLSMTVWTALAIGWGISRWFRLGSLHDQMSELSISLRAKYRSLGLTKEAVAEEIEFDRNAIERITETTIRDNSWKFVLGVICIILGVAIFLTTLFTTFRALGSAGVFISGAFGLAGTVLTGFIGVIFLRLHRTASQEAKEFKDATGVHND